MIPQGRPERPARGLGIYTRRLIPCLMKSYHDWCFIAKILSCNRLNIMLEYA